jgi:hypothetical protein
MQRYLKSRLACLGVKNNSPLICFLNHHQLEIIFYSEGIQEGFR